MIVLLAVVGGAGTWLLSRHRPMATARPSLHADRNCTAAALTLTVQASPALAVPVNQLAGDWTATDPMLHGRCVQVEVDSDTVDQQERALAQGIGLPSIWLPDSTTWVQRLQADRHSAGSTGATLAVHPSIASSPLVAVTSPAEGSRLSKQIASPDFDPLAGASIPEPVHNSEGLLALLTSAPSNAPAGLTATQATVGRLLAASRTALSTPLAGFDQLAGGAGTLRFVASEQAVIAANQQRGAEIAVALYPTQPSLGLDFPVVRVARPGDDPDLVLAADEFEQQLRTGHARDRFTAAGLRAPDGSPVPHLSATAGALADLVPPAPMPTAADTVRLVRLWNAALDDSNTLAVIDLSGSMADPAGNGQSKVAVAAAAATQATTFFPDTSALGLWVFSSDQGGAQPWQQLVPLAALGTRVGTGTQRQALIAAAASMSGRVRGGTALYDTALAAYLKVKASFDPAKINSVVLMTDGRNEDTSSSRTLPQLLAELAAAADPTRPVKIITIGIGSGADADALAKISAATGGKYYSVLDPREIAGVFLDAVAQRS